MDNSSEKSWWEIWNRQQWEKNRASGMTKKEWRRIRKDQKKLIGPRKFRQQEKEQLPVADHAPHILPEGVYQIWIQNNYNPYSKLMEQVKD